MLKCITKQGNEASFATHKQYHARHQAISVEDIALVPHPQDVKD